MLKSHSDYKSNKNKNYYFYLLLISLLSLTVVQINAQTYDWIQLIQSAGPGIPEVFAGNWNTSSINSTGQYWLAGQYGGRLYLTTDYASIWLETKPDGNTNKNWVATAMSADGSVISALSYKPGNCYISTDYGATWNGYNPAYDDSYYSTAVSSDGTIIIAATGTGYLFRTTDYGANWTDISASYYASNHYRQKVAMSADGSKIIAGIYTGRLYLSSNSGSNWTEVRPGGLDTDHNWYAVSMSADGNVIVAGYAATDVGWTNGKIYISRNAGAAWSEIIIPGLFTYYWNGANMSSNGAAILIVNYGKGLYLSTDSGYNWVAKNSGYSNYNITTAAMSGDATQAIFGIYGASLYKNTSSLPVELTSFTANIPDNKVMLRWTTATEVNNYGFEVERNPSPANPAQQWETVGFIPGHGNSNSPKSYEFIDTQITAGILRYRLKQIDNDGSFDYSDEIEVRATAPETFRLEQNYPNPFNPTTQISFSIPSDSQVEIKIFNSLGLEVATLVNEIKEAGHYSVNFNAVGLSSGIYFYQIRAGNFKRVRKMMLVK